MKKLLPLLFLAASPAMASVTVDLDKNTVTYKNDGDGMQYIVTQGQQQSVRWDDPRRFPLGVNGQPRYSFNNETNLPVVYAEAGRPGLAFTRPLADAEKAKVSEDSIKITEAKGSNALALDPKADKGPVIQHFDAWHSDSREDCKITLYEQAIDVCGSVFGRAGVVNFTMIPEGYHYYGSFYGSFNYTIGYQSREGRKAVSFRFVNQRASRQFMQKFSAWSGSNPQRI